MNTLIVDDKQLAVNALLRIMTAIDPDGCHVGVLSPVEALNYVRSHTVHVAFLDIEMAGINGLELARRMKLATPDINIIFVTGHPEYALDAHRLFVSGFLVKPAEESDVRIALQHLRNPIALPQQHVLRVQCFGNFDVFVENTPLHFKRSKSKELLAYLIDRQGATCTTGELLAVLWEDKPDTFSLRGHLRNLIYDLTHTLEDAGSTDVLIRGRSTLAVDPAKLDCDYYDFLRGVPDALNQYHGEYMAQYSWAEITAANLQNV